MSETGIIIVVVALSGLLAGGYCGYIFGAVFGYRRGQQSVIDAHNRNQEIARAAAQDPQVQAALDEMNQ